MIDPAHDATDKRIAELERRLLKLYSTAKKSLQDQMTVYFSKFEEEDKKKREQVKAGELTQEQYTQWRLWKIVRSDEFFQLQNSISEKLADVNDKATEQIGEAMPDVYTMNYNQEREDAGGEELPALTAAVIAMMKRPKLNRGKDIQWNKKHLLSSVTSGILQGKPLMGRNGICTASINFTIKRNTNVSRVNARTWLTSAETSGRQALYDAAEKIGIHLEKTWYTQRDKHVRHAHAEMEGVTVPAGEAFIVDGYRMIGPGDRSAPTRLWYNCRCRMKCRRKRG